MSELVRAATVFHQIVQEGLTQAVDMLAIDAGPEDVEVRFTTRFAVSPKVELYRSRTGDPAQDIAPQRLWDVNLPYGARNAHTVRFTGLEQGQRWWLRIVAPTGNALIKPRDGMIRVEREFGTLRRRCAVEFQLIKVFKDGDPGGDAEMSFSMSLYDGRTRAELIPPRFTHEFDDISDQPPDNTINGPFGPPVVLADAPDSIVPYVFASEDDSSIFTFESGLIGRRPPRTAPSEQSHGVFGGGEWTDVFATIGLRRRVGRDQTRFRLFTGFTPLIYEVVGDIRTVVVDPWYRERASRLHRPMLGVVARANARASLPRVLGEPMLALAVGPEDEALVAVGRDDDELAWRPVANGCSMIMAVADAAREVDLIVAGPDGALQHAHLAGWPQHDLAWRALACQVQGEVATARDREDRLWLFALDQDGWLRRGTLGIEPWCRVDGPFTGRLAGVLAGDDGDELLFQDDSRRGRYGYAARDGGAVDWQVVRVPEKGALIGLAGDDAGGTLLVALDADRRLLVATGPSEAWQVVGHADAIDDVMNENRPSVVREELIRPEPARGECDCGRPGAGCGSGAVTELQGEGALGSEARGGGAPLT